MCARAPLAALSISTRSSLHDIIYIMSCCSLAAVDGVSAEHEKSSRSFLCSRAPAPTAADDADINIAPYIAMQSTKFIFMFHLCSRSAYFLSFITWKIEHPAAMLEKLKLNECIPHKHSDTRAHTAASRMHSCRIDLKGKFRKRRSEQSKK